MGCEGIGAKTADASKAKCKLKIRPQIKGVCRRK